MTAKRPAAAQEPPADVDVELPGMPVADPAPEADRAPKRPARGAGGRFAGAGHTHERKARPFARKAKEPEPKRGPGRPSNKSTYAQLRKEVQSTLDQLVGAGAMLSLVSPKLAYDVVVIGQQSELLAAELVRLAESTPWLDRALRSAVKARESGKLLVLFTSIAVPIMANHGLLPADAATLVGAPPPPQPDVDGNQAGLGDVLNLFGQPVTNGQADHPAGESGVPTPHVP